MKVNLPQLLTCFILVLIFGCLEKDESITPFDSTINTETTINHDDDFPTTLQQQNKNRYFSF